MKAYPHGKLRERSDFITPRSTLYTGVFGRMFRNLPPYIPENGEKTLKKLAATMVEKEPGNENKKIPAGYTYFGQFIDHDITFDPTSSLQRQNDPDALQNFRTPRFDLDNLYGRGPHDDPFMYEPGTGKLLIGHGINPKEDDLPRNTQQCPPVKADDPAFTEATAIIGDPRNDENTFVSQFQLGMLKFHNKVIDHLNGTSKLEGDALFREAQRLVRWHYQYVVIHDFLKRIVGESMLKKLLPDDDCPHKPRLCYYNYKHKPFMPVEFSVAAYRFGHSMVRNTYQLNSHVGPLPIFDRAADRTALTHFGGFRRLPAAWTIQWDLFLEINGSTPQLSRCIDTKLSIPLSKLPTNVVESGIISLAERNLLRSLSMNLPSGQRVADFMCIKYQKGHAAKLRGNDPLWFYILKEAAVEHDGMQLGQVGGRIVAEVFLGLLAGDNLSYLNIDPCWTPTLGKGGKNTELKDLLIFAGVA